MRPAALAFLAWLTLTVQGMAAEPNPADKDAIRELMVRHYVKTLDLDKLVVFLNFDKDADPTEAFLARLADLKIRIRKGSKVKIVDSEKDTSQNVFDRDTNEPGVLITVSGFQVTEDGKTELRASVHKGGLWGFGGRFVVEKVKSAWRITKEVDHWEA